MVSVKVTGKFSKLECLDKTLQAKKSVKWTEFYVHFVLINEIITKKITKNIC